MTSPLHAANPGAPAGSPSLQHAPAESGGQRFPEDCGEPRRERLASQAPC